MGRYSIQATGWTTEGSWFECRQGQKNVSSPKRRGRLCGPPRLIFSEYWGSFLGVQGVWSVNLEIRLQVAPRLRVRAATADHPDLLTIINKYLSTSLLLTVPTSAAQQQLEVAQF